MKSKKHIKLKCNIIKKLFRLFVTKRFIASIQMKQEKTYKMIHFSVCFIFFFFFVCFKYKFNSNKYLPWRQKGKTHMIFKIKIDIIQNKHTKFATTTTKCNAISFIFCLFVWFCSCSDSILWPFHPIKHSKCSWHFRLSSVFILLFLLLLYFCCNKICFPMDNIEM